MKELTIEHIAPYLPYGLMVKVVDLSKPYEIIGVEFDLGVHYVKCPSASYIKFKDVKPILYPISEIDNEIQVKGKSFTPFHYLTGTECWCDAYDEWWDLQYPDYDNMMRSCPLEIAEKLFEWHLDVFGLIGKELAIDVNELEENPYK